MSFTQESPPIRQVAIQFGDTLQSIALRELGDAARWVDIALLNNLKPPYIVDSPPNAAGLLAAGDMISVPTQTGQALTYTIDPDRVFLRDVSLEGGQLQADNGDLLIVGGIPNLKQALLMKVTAVPPDLAFHPEYGCHAADLLGEKNTQAAGALAAFYVKSALVQDERVASVVSVEAISEGDHIAVDAKVMAIGGKAVDVQVVV